MDTFCSHGVISQHEYYGSVSAVETRYQGSIQKEQAWNWIRLSNNTIQELLVRDEVPIVDDCSIPNAIPPTNFTTLNIFCFLTSLRWVYHIVERTSCISVGERLKKSVVQMVQQSIPSYGRLLVWRPGISFQYKERLIFRPFTRIDGY